MFCPFVQYSAAQRQAACGCNTGLRYFDLQKSRALHVPAMFQERDVVQFIFDKLVYLKCKRKH